MLAVGFLLNQNMLRPQDRITSIDYENDLDVVVVRTNSETDFEKVLRKKTITSGCAQGTVFGDLMDKLNTISLSSSEKLRTSWLYELSKKINNTPSLYLEAGAIHGCVLCKQNFPLIYMEDVGRHNAIDKIAGYMFLHNIISNDKIFYTTGRLTSEIVMKVTQMGIPVLLSRSGVTHMGLELAEVTGITMIARAKGRHFLVYNGAENVKLDATPPARTAKPGISSR